MLTQIESYFTPQIIPITLLVLFTEQRIISMSNSDISLKFSLRLNYFSLHRALALICQRKTYGFTSRQQLRIQALIKTGCQNVLQKWVVCSHRLWDRGLDGVVGIRKKRKIYEFAIFKGTVPYWSVSLMKSMNRALLMADVEEAKENLYMK